MTTNPHRRVAQGSEQSAYIRPVVGSNPTPPTNADDHEDIIDLTPWKDRDFPKQLKRAKIQTARKNIG